MICGGMMQAHIDRANVGTLDLGLFPASYTFESPTSFAKVAMPVGSWYAEDGQESAPLAAAAAPKDLATRATSSAASMAVQLRQLSTYEAGSEKNWIGSMFHAPRRCPFGFSRLLGCSWL